MIASEANEVCEEESKKTIAPEHIITALKVRIQLLSAVRRDGEQTFQRLGFENFTAEVEDVLKDHKAQQKVRFTPRARFTRPR